MELSFQTGAFLLLIAAVVAMTSRRLHLPYSVGLVAAGAILAFLPFTPRVELTRELIFDALLPPLLFEAAFYIPWEQLRRDFPVIVTLATVGVALSAGVTAAGMHLFGGWQWMSALIFGVLIAATDPVAVIATFKEAKVGGRLLVLIEGESLLNDGTAAVAFGVVVGLAGGQQPNALAIAMALAITIVGGIVCGGVIALVAIALVGRTDDHLVEITFTTVAAWGSFLLADRMGWSGVLATITAGIVMSQMQDGRITARGQEAVQAFWEYTAFVANSMIFLLIGMHEASQNFVAVWRPAIIAIPLVTLGRAVAIYPCCSVFARTSLRIVSRHRHILFWGGLRGAVALALALGLPSYVPQREGIIAVSFGVVAFSIFVQGLTIAPFGRKMGEISPAAVESGGARNG